MVSDMVLVSSVFAVVLTAVLVSLSMYLYSRSKGSVSIVLDKYEFSPGETIKGKVVLKIKKPIQAKSLTVGLRGVMKSSSSITMGSSKQKQKDKEIFSFSQPISMAKNYIIGESEQSFTIKIPQNVLKNAEGFAGAIVNTIKLISGDTRSVYWYVDARLDIPGFDLSNTVQINVV